MFGIGRSLFLSVFSSNPHSVIDFFEKRFDKENVLTAHYKYAYDGQGNIVRSIDILGVRSIIMSMMQKSELRRL